MIEKVFMQAIFLLNSKNIYNFNPKNKYKVVVQKKTELFSTKNFKNRPTVTKVMSILIPFY